MGQRSVNGQWFTSEQVTWSVISTPVEIDPGFQVFRTRDPLSTLHLGLFGSDLVYHLEAPGPRDYFSFDRYAQKLGDHEVSAIGGKPTQERIWLYSVYGYIDPEQIICLRYRPTRDMEILVLPRPVHFPW